MKNDITNKHYLGKDAFNDWAIIFTLTCIISIFLIITGVFSYNGVGTDIRAASDSVANAAPSIDPNALKNAIKILDDRAAKTKSVIDGNMPFLSPL